MKTKSATTKPVFHWTRQRLNDSKGREMYRHYLFDQTGTLHGYIQDTDEGLYKGYAGMPGEMLGLFDTLDDAKNTILYCLIGRRLHNA